MVTWSAWFSLRWTAQQHEVNAQQRLAESRMTVGRQTECVQGFQPLPYPFSLWEGWLGPGLPSSSVGKSPSDWDIGHPYKLATDCLRAECDLLVYNNFTQNQRRNQLNTMATHLQDQDPVNEKEENIFILIPNLIGMRIFRAIATIYLILIACCQGMHESSSLLLHFIICLIIHEPVRSYTALHVS